MTDITIGQRRAASRPVPSRGGHRCLIVPPGGSRIRTRRWRRGLPRLSARRGSRTPARRSGRRPGRHRPGQPAGRRGRAGSMPRRQQSRPASAPQRTRRPAPQSMNQSHLLYVLVDMQNLKRSERVQPLDRRPRRVPSRRALAAVLFGVVVLTVFGHITAFLLFLLAGIAVLAAVLRRRRSGR
jgi:hypothetical protein